MYVQLTMGDAEVNTGSGKLLDKSTRSKQQHADLCGHLAACE